jgi:glycosyltransferase involved in cell wall biosynthesis
VDQQRTDGQFAFSILVVDNDSAGTAKEPTCRMAKMSSHRIEYHVEPEQNISLARNKAVLNSSGEFIAFIDDDELPIDEWLYHLFTALHAYHADGVMGPVLPRFRPGTPDWLLKSGICQRPSHTTGTPLRSGRTGNVLLHRRVFSENRVLFEKEYGRTGGEDCAFFEKQIKNGFTFVWCEEAPVFEDIPPERCRLRFHVAKNLRIGTIAGERMKFGIEPFWGNAIKSSFVLAFYAIFLPLSAMCPRHLFARFLTNSMYHTGRFLGALGVSIIRDR